MLRKRGVTRFSAPLAAVLSGVILWAAFPPLAQEDAAWFALVPLLLLLRRATPGRGFKLGWLAGVVFWLGNLGWLWRLIENGGPPILVILGHGALAAYCALYTGLFGALAAWLWRGRRLRVAAWGRVALAVVAVPLAWVVCEGLRGMLFTGFAWNGLGVSQYKNLALIQVASWGGVGAVSALLVAVNMAVALMLERVWFDIVMRHARELPAYWREERRLPLRTVELTLAL